MTKRAYLELLEDTFSALATVHRHVADMVGELEHARDKREMQATLNRLSAMGLKDQAGLVLASPTQAYPTMPQGIQGPFTVVKFVDGDTIHVDANGQRLKVRMIGLETPETVDPRKPVQCFGLEASAQAKTILGGRSVYLETNLSLGHHRPLRSHAGLCLDRIGAPVQPRHDHRRLCVRVHLRPALSLSAGFQGRRERCPHQ